MSKAVLLSIHSNHCYNIANYLKTIEVRKNRPSQEVPFKCYIYCTNGGKQLVFDYDDGELYYGSECSNMNDVIFNGKIIGEFICDKIDKVIPDYSRVFNQYFYDFKKMKHCLTTEELRNYGKGKPLYAWHISNLKIYDEPKDLSDFKALRGTKEEINKRYNVVPIEEQITCPPQSWRYVEELE
jgi:predicted transcriptional regulator